MHCLMRGTASWSHRLGQVPFSIHTHTLRRNGRAGPRNTLAIIQAPYSTPDPELDSNQHRVLKA